MSTQSPNGCSEPRDSVSVTSWTSLARGRGALGRMSAQQVIDESRPMLTEILRNIGLHTSDQPLDLQALLDPFSHWIETQDVRQEDTAFLAGLIGAFICEFLIEHHSATRIIRAGRIFLQMLVQDGVRREFEAYAVAVGMAQSRGSVALFLKRLTSS